MIISKVFCLKSYPQSLGKRSNITLLIFFSTMGCKKTYQLVAVELRQWWATPLWCETTSSLNGSEMVSGFLKIVEKENSKHFLISSVVNMLKYTFDETTCIYSWACMSWQTYVFHSFFVGKRGGSIYPTIQSYPVFLCLVGAYLLGFSLKVWPSINILKRWPCPIMPLERHLCFIMAI